MSVTSSTNVSQQSLQPKPKYGILCPINTNTFPGKLWKLVNDECCLSICWNSNGTSIMIKPQAFTKEVLHRCDYSAFKTRNFSSFVRQLNLYGFRKITLSCKTKSADAQKEAQPQFFRHAFFLKLRPDLLHRVKRAGVKKKKDHSPNCDLGLSPPFNFMEDFSSGDSFTSPIPSQVPWNYNRYPGSSSYNYLKPEFMDSSEAISPFLQSAIPNTPSFVLGRNQHPFYRTDTGRPCDMDLTWLANSMRGTLTATDAGSCPSSLMHNGQLRRFVVIPDDPSAIFHSGLNLAHPRHMFNDPHPAPSHFSFPPVHPSYYQSSPIPDDQGRFVRETNLIPPTQPITSGGAFKRYGFRESMESIPTQLSSSVVSSTEDKAVLADFTKDTNLIIQESNHLTQETSPEDLISPLKSALDIASAEIAKTQSILNDIEDRDFRTECEKMESTFPRENELIEVKC